MDCLLGCLATLSVLVARVVPLEHSKKFGIAYFMSLMVWVSTPSLNKESTNSDICEVYV